MLARSHLCRLLPAGSSRSSSSRYASLLTRTISSNSSEAINVFDRSAKLQQRRRALQRPDSGLSEYLREEMGWRTFDRICDIKREFDTIVDYGCGRGHIARHVTADMAKCIYQCDTAIEYLENASKSEEVPTHNVLIEGEQFFPFADNSLDLIVTSLSLHWVNDLPGVFGRELLRSLKPDGCLLGCTFGGDTLFELRCSLQLAEQERRGGYAPHVSPFTSNADIAGLLQAQGYSLVSVDVDELRVGYPSMLQLMEDLRCMGETNAAWQRQLRLDRDTLLAAAAIYQQLYALGEGEGEGEGVSATFQIVNFIGWKPHKSQQKPAKRGSADVSFQNLAKAVQKQQQPQQQQQPPPPQGSGSNDDGGDKK